MRGNKRVYKYQLVNTSIQEDATTIPKRKVERIDTNENLYTYELHFTSELVPGNVNWGKIVQFPSHALTRRWKIPRTRWCPFLRIQRHDDIMVYGKSNTAILFGFRTNILYHYISLVLYFVCHFIKRNNYHIGTFKRYSFMTQCNISCESITLTTNKQFKYLR